MKRSYPTNIDGQIFYIDEDAFILLQNYLQELHNTFSGNEGREIVADIESRIRELFTEKIDRGAAVIVLADVNSVISTMGRPEDLTDSSEAAGEEFPRNQRIEETETTESFLNLNLPGGRKLYRNMQNKVFGGVFGGLALYLGWNANIMRLLYIALTCLTYFWPCVVIYLILWMIIPPAVTPRQILRMRGEPVNVDTVGQTVIETTATGATPPPIDPDGDSNFFRMFFRTAAKVLMGFLGLIAGIIDFSLIIAFIVTIIGSIMWFGFGNSLMFEHMPIFYNTHAWLGVCMVGTWLLVGIIAMSALVWTSLSFFSCSRAASRPVVVTTLIIEILLIAAGIALSLSFSSAY